MELVPGEDLSKRLGSGAMSISESLRVGVQLAQALEAAHENGVIHRDLKPANIQITADGDVKVLDFGLAKAFENDSGASPTMTPTVTSAGSRLGMVLGTAAYMSPEQARGQELDKRSDIWSFGCVLFECLTGRQTFGGATVSDALASILRNEPDWSWLPGGTQPRLRELLERTLNKDKRNRVRDIGDVRIELEAIQALGSLPAGVPAAAGIRTRRAPGWTVVAAALLLGAVAGMWIWSAVQTGADPSAGEQLRVSISAPEGWSPFRVQITSDGKRIVYGATLVRGEERRWKIFVRELSSFESKVVEGADFYENFDLSPDGRTLAFVAPVSAGSSEQRLFTVPLDGSARPLELARWDPAWSNSFVWHPDGGFFGTTRAPQQLIRIGADGALAADSLTLELGEVQSVASLDGTSPDGRLLLGRGQTWGKRGFTMHAVTVDPATGRVQAIVEDGEYPTMVAGDRVLWSRRDALLAARRDPETGRAIGTPEIIESGMRTDESWDSARFEIASNGTLVYRTGGQVGLNRRLAFIDSRGEFEYWSEDRTTFEEMMAVSHDGKYVAVVIAGTGTGKYEVWVSEVDRPRLRVLAAYDAVDCASPVWDPTVRRVAFNRNGQQGLEGIFIKQLDQDEVIQVWDADDESSAFPLSFTGDGKALAISVRDDQGPRIVLVDLTQELPTRGETLVAGADFGRFSRDGEWFAFASTASGQFQVLVRRFENGRLTGPAVPVSGAGGRYPQWGRRMADGKQELSYWITNTSYTVALDDRGGELQMSRPELTVYSSLNDRVDTSDILPDGRRLAVVFGPEEIAAPQIAVVTNALD